MPVKKSRLRGYHVVNHKALQRLHSSYDPLKEARRLLPDKLSEGDYFIFAGAGLGYLLGLLARCCQQARVAVFDPYPELLQQGLKLGIWSPEQFADFQLFGPGETDDLARLGRFLPLEMAGSCRLLKWPEYIRKRPFFFKSALQLFKQLQQYQKINLHTLLNNAPRWLENFRRNLSLLTRLQLPHFNDGRQNIALVGAGPSLDLQLPWLQRNRDKLTVVAVNTAGPVLHKNRIQCDLCVAVDPHPLIYEDLVHSGNPPLLLGPFVDPRITEKLEQPAGLIALDSPLTEWLQSASFLPRMRPGGTVTATLAEYFSRTATGRIFLLGNDMSSTPGRYYAGGSWRVEKLLQKLTRFAGYSNLRHSWDKAKRQGQNADSSFARERDWFNRFAAQTAPDCFSIPPPAPDWWNGALAPETLTGKPQDGLTFFQPASSTLRGWLSARLSSLEKLRAGCTSAEDWEKFEFWIRQLLKEPEAELTAWQNSFEELLSNL